MRLSVVLFVIAMLALNGFCGDAETAATDRHVSAADNALLESLEASFASITTVKSRFTQRKMLKIFKRTIVLEGRLSLANPNMLAWRTDSPIKYELVLDGTYARQWDEETKKIRRDKVAGDPVFEEVLSQISKWFSGQFRALLDDYDLVITSQAPLTLEFRPLSGSLNSKVIKRISILIRDDRKYVEGITIEDLGGDLTEMSFYDTVLNEPIDASEWKVGQGGE